MQIRELSIPNAYELKPTQHVDERGVFLEWFRRDRFELAVGHSLALAQANLSVSARGVVRGIHFADVPPGQAKYITCASGAVLDVVVDLRTGSPTFGRWEAVRLDDLERRCVFIAEGLGHAFVALSDGATVAYMCSTQYTPGREHGIHPLDTTLGIDWPTDTELRLSSKDAGAPGLLAAQASGLLPTYPACLDLYESRSQPEASPRREGQDTKKR